MNNRALIPIRPLCLMALAAALWGCEKYESKEGSSQADFNFTLHDTTGARADGTSLITLRITNTQEVKEGMRVVFETNKGTLLESEKPYTGHQVETKLQLAEDTGTYVLKAKLKEGDVVHVEKSMAVKFRPAYHPSEFSLEIFDSTGVRANGSSTIGVRLQRSGTYKPGSIVHFEATKGTLLQPDVPFESGSAITYLTVGQETGPYQLKAQLKEGDKVKIEKTVLFTLRRAHADAIHLEPGASTWNPAQSLVIKTLLTRADGKVSTGQPVFYRAFQLGSGGDTISVGRLEGLLNNVSNAAGMLTDIKLYADTPGMDTTKALGLQAKALNDRGDTVRTTIMFPYR